MVILIENFRRSIIIAELWRPEVAKRYKKFWEISAFSSRHRSTCCVQIAWNLADVKTVNSCVAYLKKISPGSPAVATARIAPELLQSQHRTVYSECSRFHPNRFTFFVVIVERVNAAKMCRKVNPIFGWSLASSRIKTVLGQRSRSDRLRYCITMPIQTGHWPLTLTYDLDFQSDASYDHDPFIPKNSRSKVSCFKR